MSQFWLNLLEISRNRNRDFFKKVDERMTRKPMTEALTNSSRTYSGPKSISKRVFISFLNARNKDFGEKTTL
jgi:hypothetical protein